MKDANRRSIGMANDNPILDWRMYEIEYCDGYVAAISANVIAKNLSAQVDQGDNRFVMIKSIINTRTDNTKILQQDAFVITKSVTNRGKIQLKDGNSVSNGGMVVLYGKNLNISRINIQYKWQSMRLRIEFWRIQNLHGGLNTCWIKETKYYTRHNDIG